MGDKNLPQAMAFAFLEEMASEFETRFGDLAQSAMASAMQEDFEGAIRNLMVKYNSQPADKVEQVCFKRTIVLKPVIVDNRACEFKTPYPKTPEYTPKKPTNNPTLPHPPTPPQRQKTQVRSQITQIHDVMIDNIEAVLMRQEKIELLVEKTADMQGRQKFSEETRKF